MSKSFSCFALSMLLSISAISHAEGVWVWANSSQTEYFMSSGNSLEEAEVHAQHIYEFMPNKMPPPLVACIKPGWFALVSSLDFNDSSETFAGACEKPTRDQAISSAVRSCFKKPQCAARLSDLGFALEIISYQVAGAGKTDARLLNTGLKCEYNPRCPNCTGCSVSDDSGSYGNNSQPFDRNEFLRHYSR